MSKSQWLSIIGVMVLSFTAALLWLRQGERPRDILASSPADSVPAKSPVVEFKAVSPSIGPVPRPVAVSVPAARQKASREPSELAQADEPKTGPVPIGINVYNRRARHRFEGYIASSTPRPLSVTVDVVDKDGRPIGSHQFELAPWQHIEFNSESGFAMGTTDRLVVHSPPYDDVTVDVP
jgi:hypothetical protein